MFFLKRHFSSLLFYEHFRAGINQPKQFDYILVAHSYTSYRRGRTYAIFMVGTMDIDIALIGIYVTALVMPGFHAFQPHDTTHDNVIRQINASFDAFFQVAMRYPADKNFVNRHSATQFVFYSMQAKWRLFTAILISGTIFRGRHRKLMNQFAIIIQQTKLLLCYVDIYRVHFSTLSRRIQSITQLKV